MLLECDHCEQKCERTIINGMYYEVKICTCGSLFCGFCAHSNKCNCSPVEQWLEFPLFSKMLTFAINAPRDQLGLIDLQVCLDVKCNGCDIRNDKCKLLYRSEIQQVLCFFCLSPPQNHGKMWPTTTVTERLFLEYMQSLYTSATPRTRVQRAELRGKLPVNIVDLRCESCGQDICAKNNNSSRPFILNGEPFCYECGTNPIYKYLPASARCACLCKFIECIGCIPENQLHLLTFKKWVKAIGCHRHAPILNGLIAASSDGITKGTLQSFFKGGDANMLPSSSGTSRPLPSVPRIDFPTSSTFASDLEQLNAILATLTDLGTLGNLTPIQDDDQYDSIVDITTTKSIRNSDVMNIASKLSTVDISTPVAPVWIACLCGREDDISNVFFCNTCSVYGVCGLCTTRNHWGHEILDTAKTTATVSTVSTRAELTLQKLGQWSAQALELNQKGEKAFKKLCRVLGATFEDAMINSEDHRRIHTLLERANTSTIERHFKETVNSTRRELAERLKKTPELSHINVRRAETPKQRHEGYLRRKAAREEPLTPCVPEIKEPTSPIENTREELQLVMPSPQLPVIEPIAHPVQLPTAEPPVSPIPLLDQQSLDHFSESFGKAFEKAMEKAFIEKYGCKD